MTVVVGPDSTSTTGTGYYSEYYSAFSSTDLEPKVDISFLGFSVKPAYKRVLKLLPTKTVLRSFNLLLITTRRRLMFSLSGWLLRNGKNKRRGN